MIDRKPGGQPKPAASRKRNNLTFRTRDGLREELEAAANLSGHSISEEIERRLQRSFSKDDALTDALGGPELRNMAISTAHEFASAARSEALRKGQSDWSAADWLRDKDCYRSGMTNVLWHLIDQMPDLSHEDMEVLPAVIETGVGSALIRSGKLKFDFGRGPEGDGFIKPKDETQ